MKIIRNQARYISMYNLSKSNFRRTFLYHEGYKRLEKVENFFGSFIVFSTDLFDFVASGEDIIYILVFI